jgi:hypothetical protein
MIKKYAKGIFLKFYEKIILNFFSYIIAPKTKKVCKLIIPENSNNKKIFFHFYKSIDCELINLSIIKNLKKNNTIKINDIILPSISEFVVYSKNTNNENFQKLYQSIKDNCKKYKLNNLYYSIIDEFHYAIRDPNLNPLLIKSEFFYEIEKIKKKISELANKFDILVISDCAYLLNNIFKQEFLIKKKRVLTIQTSGVISNHKKINLGENSVNSKYSKKYIFKYLTNKKIIDNFIKKRFLGKSNNKIFNKSFLPNNKENNKNNYKKCKILFINEFVDASNINWTKKQIFNSNLEFVEFSLKIIRQNNFKNFYIKLHPLTKFFPGNNKIIQYLLKKYEIPKNCIDNCPDLKTILKKKIPIYSHNGSIILETLVSGYKTYFCGSRFDNNFGNKANSKTEWARILLDNSKKNVEKIDNNIILQAKYILWRDFAFKNIQNLFPDTFIVPWNSRLDKLFIFLNQLKNIFFIQKDSKKYEDEGILEL